MPGCQRGMMWGKNAVLSSAGRMAGWYSFSGGQFSNCYQNLKCSCALTKQLHFWKSTIQICWRMCMCFVVKKLKAGRLGGSIG